MTHAWISTADGDLLRANQTRQINVVEGLRIVTIGGSQFVIAEIEGRQGPDLPRWRSVKALVCGPTALVSTDDRP